MLSKSQARAFFLSATLGFSGVFLALTVDTIRQIPARSHESELTPQVAQGKALWDSNNCMGCHTLLGEGAYYAPELTKVVDRRGGTWIKTFMKDPAGMFPGERKMTKYDFTDAELDSIVAFFTWIGKVDTNGFPAPADLAPKAPVPTSVAAGGPVAPMIFTQICTSCHSVGGAGGNVGPALDGVGNRYDEAKLRAWLHNPTSIKPGTKMPNLHLAEQDVDALVPFLLSHR